MPVDYLKKVWLCQICAKREATVLHAIKLGESDTEILPDRKKRAGQLAVCTKCAPELTDAQKWPTSRKLAAKFLADPLTTNPREADRSEPINWMDVAKWLMLRPS